MADGRAAERSLGLRTGLLCPKNIDWGETASSDVVRTESAPKITVNRNATPATATVTDDEPWPGRIVYTLDGSEPDASSPQWPPELILPLTQSVTVTACTLRLDTTNPGNKARLTLVNAEKLAGEWISERFTVRALTLPGKRFSHWKVTGPLRLDDPTQPEVSFYWMTREPLTLEAVYIDLGYLFRLR